MSKIVDKSVKNSKNANLEYKVIKNFTYNNKEYSLVDINLNTGRHHQIRVQFAGIGAPLYGDQNMARR